MKACKKKVENVFWPQVRGLRNTCNILLCMGLLRITVTQVLVTPAASCSLFLFVLNLIYFSSYCCRQVRWLDLSGYLPAAPQDALSLPHMPIFIASAPQAGWFITPANATTAWQPHNNLPSVHTAKLRGAKSGSSGCSHTGSITPGGNQHWHFNVRRSHNPFQYCVSNEQIYQHFYGLHTIHSDPMTSSLIPALPQRVVCGLVFLLLL